MATVIAFIRTQKSDKDKSSKIRFRLRDGRDYQLFHKSELFILPEKWDVKQQKIKARCIIVAPIWHITVEYTQTNMKF